MATKADTGHQTSTNIPSFGDPPDRTLAAVYREIAKVEFAIQEKFEAQQKAVDLIQEAANSSPTSGELATKLASYEKLVDEKFTGCAQRINDLKVQLEAAMSANERTVSKALDSAKELVQQQNTSNVAATGKSEHAFSELIAKQGDLIRSETKALSERITDMKEVVDRVRGAGQAWAILSAAIATIVSVAGFVIVIATRQ